jgi:hypothetical protein
MVMGLAFAVAVFAGRTSVAAAKFDEGVGGHRYVSAGGWSGEVDMQSGVPVSAGIPEGDEQFVAPQGVQVIPYLSHGILTEADAQVVAPLNRIERALQGPQVIPYLSHGVLTETDAQVLAATSIPDPNLGRFDGDQIALANALAVRPDDVADRFAHSDVPAPPEVVSSSGGSTVEWNDALTAAIAAFVLVLGLGLAIGRLRRPKLAGL